MPSDDKISLERETDRLVLRPLDDGDAEAVRAITDDPAITDAIDFLPSPFSLDDARAVVRGKAGDRMYGAWHRASGALIGVVGTHRASKTEIEIGYWIATPFQGDGYASEAVGRVITVLRELHPKHTIFAECRSQNRASWRVLEKLGFFPTGGDGHRAGRKKLILGLTAF